MLGNCPISPPEGWGSQKPPTGVGLDRSHSLTRDLEAFWALNEAAGNRILDAARRRVGIGSGTSWTGTPHGVGLMFPGSSTYVSIPQMRAPDNTHDFSMWAKVLFNSTGAGQLLIELNAASTIGAGLGITASRKLAMYYRGEQVGAYGNAVLPSGQWYTVAIVYSAETGKVSFFVNGRLDTSVAVGTFDAGTVTGFMGKAFYGDYYLSGTLAAVGYWRRQLTATELENLHVLPYCLFESGGLMAAPSGSRPLIENSLASGTQLLGAVV